MGILFSFRQGYQFIKTVHHSKYTNELNLEGFLFTKLSEGLFLTAGISLHLLVWLPVTSAFFQAKIMLMWYLSRKDFKDFPKSDTSKVPILDQILQKRLVTVT